MAVGITNRSGTITTGGVAQQLMPANGYRRRFWIQNLSAGDLYFSEVGTASASQPSVRIPAGALYESPEDATAQTAISIFGATTAQAFAAREV